MPEAVGNARRERAVLLGTLHDPLGARMPGELRAPARGSRMSGPDAGIVAMLVVMVGGTVGLLLVGWRMRA